MRVLAIVNPAACAVAAYGGPEWRARISDAVGAEGVDATVTDLVRIDPAGVLARARDAGADAVVAGGGDGTVGAVAGALVGHAMPLGILPLGTLNHFARDLGIPLALDAAIRVVAAGRVRTVDVGEVNGRVFVNNSSIGLYPRIVRKRNEMMERLGRGKWVAALFAAASVLRRFPLLGVRLRIEQESAVRTTPFVFVGNNQYEIDLFRLGRRAGLDCGVLSLYLPVSSGRFAMLRLTLRALFGLIEQGKDFESICAPELTVETKRRRLHVALDGEVLTMHPPLRYRARPLALRVLVPPDSV